MDQTATSKVTTDSSASAATNQPALPENRAKTRIAIGLVHLETSDEIRNAFPVMQQLRPHLANDADMLTRIQRMQQSDGYRLLAAVHDDQVVALAGYRIQENLIYGRFLYVDDLVTLDAERGGRLGARLLDEARRIARTNQCNKLVLDTGLANCLAQRFYFRQGLLSMALHFSETLTPA